MQSLVFVLPVLEPGASGVGDYAIRLAGSLERIGCRAAAISLREEDALMIEEGERAGTPILRLGQSVQGASRARFVGAFLRRHGMDTARVSLQYVPYAYDARGLPLSLKAILKRLFFGGVAHIMFHEVWIGAAGGNLKQRLLGWLQRTVALRLVRRLKPLVVHTHAGVYAEILAGCGIAAQRLPLFSNIPVRMAAPGEMEPCNLQALWCANDAEDRIRILLFGRAYPGFDCAASLEALGRTLAAAGRRGVVVAAGHLGFGQEELARAVEGVRGVLNCVARGVVSENEAGRLLRTASYGVSTSPPDLIEKSAAAAAMFEYGLPVIAPRAPVFGTDAAEKVAQGNPLLIWGRDIETMLFRKRSLTVANGAERAAEQLLSDLTMAEATVQAHE